VYTAVLDTVVLVPSLQRDFLLQLAAELAYAPLWSSGTIDELDAVLPRIDARRDKPHDEEARKRLLAAMQRAFPGALIEAPREREYGYDIADVDDGHVVHAAVMGKADALVTGDKKARFEKSRVLAEAQVEVISVAEFAANSVAAHIDSGIRAIRQMAKRFEHPPMTERQILDVLADRYGMDEVRDLLAPHFAE